MTTMNETDLHPIHGFDTCEEVEESQKRAWEKVQYMTTQMRDLQEQLTTAQRSADNAESYNESLQNLTNDYLELSESVADIEDLAESRRVASEILPNAEAVIQSAWRESTGRTRGPIPAEFSEFITTDEAAKEYEAALREVTARLAKKFTASA